MEFNDTIKLCFENNLIISNLPSAITLERLQERHPAIVTAGRGLEVMGVDTERFGLFDSNSNNLNTYYPDVTEEDLKPKENDFITPTFRALSEVVVHKEWNPVDFSMGGILKKSTSLLIGQTVNADHETAIGNSLGAVAATAWEEAYKDKSGIPIPAGINAILKIDGKSNPKIARGVMMEPPAIHSTSVTVNFLWDKSHASLSEEEFFNKLGTYDKDGQLIRRVATMVKKYNEISLVPHGADPFAQLKKDGSIVNPKYANISYNSLKDLPGDLKAHAKHYFFNFKSDVIENSIPAGINNTNNNQQPSTIMKKELLIMLAAFAGLTISNAEAATETELAELESKLRDKIAQATLTATAEAEVTRLKAIETEYNKIKDTAALSASDSAELISLRSFAKSQEDALRAETIANYNRTLGADKTADATVLESLNKANYQALILLNGTYVASLEEKFPLTCKECGSHEVSRATAMAGNGGNGGQESKDGLAALLKKKSGLSAANNMHSDK